MTERVVASRRIYEGRVVNLRVDTVELANGHLTQREIVEHVWAVALVALDAQGSVLLVRQFRLAAGREMLEIPAGTQEPGEELDACAARELQEETGFAAGRLERLGEFYTSPGFCTERIALYLATDLRPSPLVPEADEAIHLVRLPLAEALGMVSRGDICDAKSIVGLLTVAARLKPH
jgi:ADP-ribose pyrophosphatase